MPTAQPPAVTAAYPDRSTRLLILGIFQVLLGCFISGVTGAVVILLIALVMAYLAWGTYRLKMAAWWGTLLFVRNGGGTAGIS